MRTVEVFAQSDLDPAVSQALDNRLLAAAAGQPSCARLRVYRLAGDVLSLGRYHLAPAADAEGRVRLHRRLGGGRVLPLGAGFMTVSLLLPHRSALVADDPLALRPEQALNRCVRALLGGLRALGVEAFYPGRDRITLDGRMLGVVSLECDRGGATAFEAMLAIDDDWSCLPALVAAVDREQVLAAEIPTPEHVTSLSARGVSPTVDTLAECIADSLARQFGLEPTAGSDVTIPAGAAADAAVWIASRRRPPALGRHALEWGQLGVFEVYLAIRDGTIADVLLAGDFIADSPSIARLEQRLRGCAFDRAAIGRIVDEVYADPRSFLLGIGPLRAIADTIARAA
jgi:lipoate-protein ligase A